MAIHIDAFQRWQSKWLVGTLEFFAFFVLKHKTSYGGELLKMSRKYVDDQVKVPTLYGILSRAESSGLIRQSELVSEDGITRGTSRKYYELTEEGELYFQLMKEQLLSVEEVLLVNSQLLEDH